MSRFDTKRQILVTGGAGYVGAVLVPKLLRQGYRVRVLDLYLYGSHVLEAVRDCPGLEEVRGDLRDTAVLERCLLGCDTVIHLACISNDPSFELDPALGCSINYDAFFPLVRLSKATGVRRFIYASSSSVYGVKEEPEVTEDLPLEPLTDYSRYKALCEQELDAQRGESFETVTIRPATVCGYSPRLRLDLVMNIFTNHALVNRKICVFGGMQKRPNIHIEDITDLYVRCVEAPAAQINGKVYNAGTENHRISELADIVRTVVGGDVRLELTTTNDERSYHISSRRVERDLGFVARRPLSDAVRDLVRAYEEGLVPNPMTDRRYYNLYTMRELKLT